MTETESEHAGQGQAGGVRYLCTCSASYIAVRQIVCVCPCSSTIMWDAQHMWDVLLANQSSQVRQRKYGNIDDTSFLDKPEWGEFALHIPIAQPGGCLDCEMECKYGLMHKLQEYFTQMPESFCAFFQNETYKRAPEVVCGLLQPLVSTSCRNFAQSSLSGLITDKLKVDKEQALTSAAMAISTFCLFRRLCKHNTSL